MVPRRVVAPMGPTVAVVRQCPPLLTAYRATPCPWLRSLPLSMWTYWGSRALFLSRSVALPHVCREGEVRPARPVSPAGTFDAEFALVSPAKEVLA